QYSALKHQLETLTAQELQARKEQDYNQFLYDELVAANLSAPQEDEADEQVQLESEAELLNHTEQLQEAFTAIVQNCDNDDDGIIARLTKAKADLAHIQSYQADLPEIAMRMDSTIIELRDIISSIQQINNNLDYSPQRLQYITDRLDLIYRLEKKHATNSITQLIAIRDNLKSTLEAQQSLTEQISATMEEVDNAFKQLQATADLLTQCRLEAASYIETSILPILTDLGMRESQIQVRLTPSSDYGNMGHDDIQILFNANRGGELKPLHKAASGGELSRLMLAIKVICNQVNTQTAPTQQSDYRKSLIFDEIDTGVSGDISVAVGKMMRQMNYGCQVIAITHLPQIAAKADQHFKVSKAIDATANRTISTMSPLTTDQRINEIAVMLSSNPPTAAAIQIAHELMN
ncbi:MAG: hypothetical protein KBT04_05775, partial [Bacteroidales bacterium]|nr:hypothetical protein [Candidatus Colimorpha onthohippi]